MLLPIAAIVAGLIILVFGADRFVAGAAALAKHFGLPPLLIGIVVIGFGTSMPELLVSSTAALKGTPGIALGNAYGSNITNILLILGVCAMISPLRVTDDASRRELPLLLASTALTVVLIYNGVISRMDAVILLLFFCVSMYITISHAKTPEPELPADERKVAGEISADIKPMRVGTSVFWLIVGLALMLLSSNILVWGAVAIAHHFGISDLVIGLTIVAIGTSLPELASSVVATRRGEDDLALGNIIGSNHFNSLVVIGVAGLISPLPAEHDLLWRDIPIMAFVTVLLYIFCRCRPSRDRITRAEGTTLFLIYVAYTAYLILTSGATGGA